MVVVKTAVLMHATHPALFQVTTYSALLWTGLGALSYPADSRAAGPGAPPPLRQLAGGLAPEALHHARRTRAGVVGVVGLTGLTILSGAFVAGNDAGRAYNTYPLMDGQLVPWDDLVDPALAPRWRNLFENTATVQFNHRALGTCTALGALGAAGFGLLHPAGRCTPQVRRGLVALGGAATAQMSLGIATLLTYVPLNLAASHQLGSLVVLTCGMYTAHSLRYAGQSALSRAGGQVAQGLVRGNGGGGVIQKGALVVNKVARFTGR